MSEPTDTQQNNSPPSNLSRQKNAGVQKKASGVQNAQSDQDNPTDQDSEKEEFDPFMDLEPSSDITTLLTIMRCLRDTERGCPWDIKQDFTTIAPYAIEEAHEVVDAIQRNDMIDLCDELGDLLLQVVFHAQMAEEDDIFTFGDVVMAITKKMISRHPHVFGQDAAQMKEEDIRSNWQAIKAREREEKRLKKEALEQDTFEKAAFVAEDKKLNRVNDKKPSRAKDKKSSQPPSLLDDISPHLPPLLRANKLQRRAATVGFDWPHAQNVFTKLEEEVAELGHEIEHSNAFSNSEDKQQIKQRIEDEFGDTLFALINLARHLKISPEMALRRTNDKFIRRFQYIEQRASEDDHKLDNLTLEHLDGYWQEIRSKDSIK